MTPTPPCCLELHLTISAESLRAIPTYFRIWYYLRVHDLDTERKKRTVRHTGGAGRTSPYTG